MTPPAWPSGSNLYTFGAAVILAAAAAACFNDKACMGGHTVQTFVCILLPVAHPWTPHCASCMLGMSGALLCWVCNIPLSAIGSCCRSSSAPALCALCRMLCALGSLMHHVSIKWPADGICPPLVCSLMRCMLAALLGHALWHGLLSNCFSSTTLC